MMKCYTGTVQPIDAFNMWHEDCPHCLGYEMLILMRNPKFLIGDDFFTDLTFNPVTFEDYANLQIHWVIEFTDASSLDHAPTINAMKICQT